MPAATTAPAAPKCLITRKYGNTVRCMKTTVDLPEELLIEAKKRAAEQRQPLRELLTEGLRAVLERPRRGTDGKKRIRWVTVRGGLPPVDIESRAEMHEWLRKQR